MILPKAVKCSFLQTATCARTVPMISSLYLTENLQANPPPNGFNGLHKNLQPEWMNYAPLVKIFRKKGKKLQ